MSRVLHLAYERSIPVHWLCAAGVPDVWWHMHVLHFGRQDYLCWHAAVFVVLASSLGQPADDQPPHPPPEPAAAPALAEHSVLLPATQLTCPAHCHATPSS
jgi:hypothetical protein